MTTSPKRGEINDFIFCTSRRDGLECKKENTGQDRCAVECDRKAAGKRACGHASGSEKGRDSSGCAGIYIPTASCTAQTAQEAAIALDIPCIAADGLREMDMGDWEGRSWESITQENAKEYQDWDANRRYVHTPHGECYNEVLRRALDTLGMILERETEDVLIVTHSGVLMALRCYIAGQTFEEMGIIRYKTKNAEVVEIFADDVKDAIERFQKGE